MQGLWHLRQQNGASHQDEITVDGVTFHRRDETLASIRAKLDAGGSLTEEERAYLRQHDPQAYQELFQEEQEQAAYERALRSCKTREEADRLQMNRIGQSLSRIQTVEHDPAIPLHAKLKVAMRKSAWWTRQRIPCGNLSPAGTMTGFRPNGRKQRKSRIPR